MANPFEDDNAEYYVLVNDEGQYSIWPVFARIPEGWKTVHGAASRQECLDHVNENWTDMRPRSLAEAMTSQSA
ncbi:MULTISPECIES: MbtH family protein [Streptomyces]|uniref:MbtH-like protein n=1 Tax=Streptomyces griseus subsp. griseus (strain JCM 4626 / CBS 651.72 / NBRC 13350 / KCC S-0626 / ISP 5235) TaxID=455632 RepID=B1VL57_STRGG|nr:MULTISPECIES: MbtH family protein [Streptomyces]MYR14551.1 MbtH family NRPS accessory protein [Streptomyces sp. SID724]MYT79214.1 MbtH family NRPS accessory protein [Streptomyces sp. SID8364]MBW3705730.1 MbtH family protein [Streptomyces griseus]NEB54394.1 MbtH family protein [Streptomyces griseus]SBU93055.1 MbtH protein [Streptomyces sp. MnatMP-M77]